jgi:anti-sigma-K factor RskA
MSDPVRQREPADACRPSEAERAGRRVTPWWARLNLWRALAFAGFALAFALGWTMLAPRTERPDERIVAVLGHGDAKPALVATAERSGRHLSVKGLEQAVPTPGHVLELWVVPEGRAPLSLGVVPPSGTARVALGAPAGILFQRIPKLALSLEPSAGAPHERPSGPMLYSGEVQLLY